MPPAENKDSQARRYSTARYSLELIGTVYLFVLLAVFAGLGVSKTLAREISGRLASNAAAIAVYFLAVYLAYYLFNLPLNYYRSYVLEHKFGLSRQSIPDWLRDQAKALILSCLIGAILVESLYYVLGVYPRTWWLVISFFWIFFNLVLAKLLPVVIIPLFFKYTRLSDGALRQRIISLADKMKVKILDVFQIDFSKKTLKANAAFVGWGATKRIILADTLKDKYSYDEIGVILAHEFAHYRLKHLFKLMAINSLASLLSFYVIFKTCGQALAFFDIASLPDMASLPVILMYMAAFGVVTQPLANYASRRMEMNADKLALETTGSKEAFISMMDKLASQNLSDRKPRLLIKLFFFDHPPVDERIAMARSYK